jgi:hypothetical protein
MSRQADDSSGDGSNRIVAAGPRSALTELRQAARLHGRAQAPVPEPGAAFVRRSYMGIGAPVATAAECAAAAGAVQVYACTCRGSSDRTLISRHLPTTPISSRPPRIQKSCAGAALERGVPIVLKMQDRLPRISALHRLDSTMPPSRVCCDPRDRCESMQRCWRGTPSPC